MNRRDFLLLAGTVVGWPLGAHGQQNAMPLIGYLHFGSPDAAAYQAAAFRAGLMEAGYIEKQNVAIEYRWADGRYDRLPEMAADLVGRKVDVIAAAGPPAARAAKNATTTIPIVFATGTDPIADRLIVSLARPGGNLTGVSLLAFDLTPKRFDLLADLAVGLQSVALLVNPRNAYAEHMIADAEEAARTQGKRLFVLKASSENDIDAAFTTLVDQHIGGLIVDPEPFLTTRDKQIVALAARYAIPAIFGWRQSSEAGGLMSYGPSLASAARQVGIYAGRILKGEKPANLPVQQPTVFELVINLKTAKALSLTVPQALLVQAEVIE